MKHWLKQISKITVFIVAFFILISEQSKASCTSNESAYFTEKIDSSNIEIEKSTLFTDIYNKIFEPNCAMSSCHDGNFEPDFTTIQNAYFTTVYHPLIKNAQDSSFQYRVLPFQPEKSMLVERITNCCLANENDIMPLLMGALPQTTIDSIVYWINAGAPDMFNEFPYKIEKE